MDQVDAVYRLAYHPRNLYHLPYRPRKDMDLAECHQEDRYLAECHKKDRYMAECHQEDRMDAMDLDLDPGMMGVDLADLADLAEWDHVVGLDSHPVPVDQVRMIA